MVSTKERIRQVLFKDRGMVMAVAKAKEEGSEAIIVHQQVIHQHQPQRYATSWDEMYNRNP